MSIKECGDGYSTLSHSSIVLQRYVIRGRHSTSHVCEEVNKVEFCIDRYTFLDLESDDDIIVVDDYIYASHHATVYRGKSGDVPLMVKMCHNQKFSKDFSDEAQIYETLLSELQGDIIPNLYGYFKERDHENRRISCLVLEDCGDALETPFHRLDQKKK